MKKDTPTKFISKFLLFFTPDEVIQKRKNKQEQSLLELEISNSFDELRSFFLKDVVRFFNNHEELCRLLAKKIPSSNFTGATVSLLFICDTKKYDIYPAQVGSVMVRPKLILFQPRWELEEVEASACLFKSLKKEIVDLPESTTKFENYLNKVVLYFEQSLKNNTIRSSNWLILKMTQGILTHITGSEIQKKYDPLLKRVETIILGWPM